MMQMAGISVDVAEHGGRAVEMLYSGKHYDVVLMDLQMPEVDGYTATATIRRDASKAHIPIIAMTAYAMSDERQRCLDAGMNDHISKPIDPDMLFDALARWRGKRAPAAATIYPNNANSLRPALRPNTRPPLPSNLLQKSKVEKEIDLQNALRRVGGNIDLYRKLLGRFSSKSANAAQEIADLLDKNERLEAERMAHTLRGVAGNLGANRLAEIAAELEQAINQNADNQTELLAQFALRFTDFAQEANVLLAGQQMTN
ncbi:MAG: response regulator [Burkholderiales bacterium]|nr:response regulator [Burkholderiales bacterium]